MCICKTSCETHHHGQAYYWHRPVEQAGERTTREGARVGCLGPGRMSIYLQ